MKRHKKKLTKDLLVRMTARDRIGPVKPVRREADRRRKQKYPAKWEEE